jgi:hypothetical protein
MIRVIGPIALVVVPLAWAFRTGQLWDEPDRLADFWILQSLALGFGVVLGLGGQLARWLWARRGSRFKQGRQAERVATVAFLRQQAEAHRQHALRLPEDEAHAFRVGELALDSCAVAVEHGHHVRSEDRS